MQAANGDAGDQDLFIEELCSKVFYNEANLIPELCYFYPLDPTFLKWN